MLWDSSLSEIVAWSIAPPLMQMAFGITFMICRLIVGPFVVYHCLNSRTSSNVVKVREVNCAYSSLCSSDAWLVGHE